MKKILSLLFCAVIFVTQLQAQWNGSGRYIIKLAKSRQAIEEQPNYGSVQAIDACPDYKINCDGQLWDFTPVPGMANYFYIQNVKSKNYLTAFKECNTCPANHLSNQLKTTPLQSGTTTNMQKFSIADARSTNTFYIFPHHPDMEDVKDANYFLGAGYIPASILNATIIINCMNIACNPRFYNNEQTIEWTFFPVPIVVQANMPPPKVTRSPDVIVAPPSDNKIEIDFTTGSDNLEPKGFQKNLQLTIKIKNRASIVMDDVNKNQTWPNNSIRRVSVPLPADINVADLESIMLLRTVVSNWNNVDGGMADNWNLDKITATAIVKTDGRMVRTLLLNTKGAPGQPLFRFIYENRGNTNPNEGLFRTFDFGPGRYGTSAIPGATPTMAAISAVFGTGGDNLEGGNDNNVDLIIRFRSSSDVITIQNLNNTAKWGNFTENLVTKTIPNSTNLDINDIKEIELRHTGGGGIFADNWYLDKFMLTITKGAETKVLIDKVQAPIHYFTGDTRRKVFRIEN